MQQTNWQVITGAPCSGKTAVIQELEQLGYPVVHEVARAYIDERLKTGETITGIKSDILSFERHILYKKIEIEQALPKNETVFLDRAVPDSIGYYMQEGLNPADPIQKSKFWRYEHIFFFERIHFKKDLVRSENEKGYDIIVVPLLSVKQRAGFILKNAGLI
ncbi:MAG: ATP-binding protein [Desulfobacterales bacterium]